MRAEATERRARGTDWPTRGDALAEDVPPLTRRGCPDLARRACAGLLALPAGRALAFWASLVPQPDPATDYDAWARFVTTDGYVLGHVLGSGLGLVLTILGAGPLAAWLWRGLSPRLRVVAAAATILASAALLMPMGVPAFAAPVEGPAHLAGIEGLAALPGGFSGTVFGAVSALVIVLSPVGHLRLGVAVWRSGVLPRGAGAMWAAAALLMYVLGLVLAIASGGAGAPVTVPLGALLMVWGGAWMAGSVLAERRPTR